MESEQAKPETQVEALTSLVPKFDDEETQALLAKVKALPPIETEEQAEVVASYSKGFYAVKDRVHQVYDDIAALAYGLHKRITTDRGKELAKADQGLSVTNRLYSDWEDKKEKARKAEEERLRREAEKEMEAEQIARAQEAMEDGDDEQAEAILEEPPEPPPLISVPKAKADTGLTTTETWVAQVVSLPEVIKAAADGKISPKYLTVDMTFANQQARSLKKDFRVPGLRAVPKRGVRRTGR